MCIRDRVVVVVVVVVIAAVCLAVVGTAGALHVQRALGARAVVLTSRAGGPVARVRLRRPHT
eukprot:11280284-Alexandrium_andersonii.AAC.1